MATKTCTTNAIAIMTDVKNSQEADLLMEMFQHNIKCPACSHPFFAGEYQSLQTFGTYKTGRTHELYDDHTMVCDICEGNCPLQLVFK
jgi:hypothetical protein